MNRRQLLKSAACLGLYTAATPYSTAETSEFNTNALRLKMKTAENNIHGKLKRLGEKVDYSLQSSPCINPQLMYRLNFRSIKNNVDLNKINVTFINGNAFYSERGEVPNIHRPVNYQQLQSDNRGIVDVDTQLPNSQVKGGKVVNPNYFVINASGKISAFMVNHLGYITAIPPKESTNLGDSLIMQYHQNPLEGYIEESSHSKNLESIHINILLS